MARSLDSKLKSTAGKATLAQKKARTPSRKNTDVEDLEDSGLSDEEVSTSNRIRKLKSDITLKKEQQLVDLRATLPYIENEFPQIVDYKFGDAVLGSMQRCVLCNDIYKRSQRKNHFPKHGANSAFPCDRTTWNTIGMLDSMRATMTVQYKFDCRMFPFAVTQEQVVGYRNIVADMRRNGIHTVNENRLAEMENVLREQPMYAARNAQIHLKCNPQYAPTPNVDAAEHITRSKANLAPEGFRKTGMHTIAGKENEKAREMKKEQPTQAITRLKRSHKMRLNFKSADQPKKLKLIDSRNSVHLPEQLEERASESPEENVVSLIRSDVIDDHSHLRDSSKGLDARINDHIEVLPSDNPEDMIQNSKITNAEVSAAKEQKSFIKLPNIYSKSFDIPMFTEDEVDVSLFERTVRIKCKREVYAVGVIGRTLNYSLELPARVDLSTFHSRWTYGELKISAHLD